MHPWYFLIGVWGGHTYLPASIELVGQLHFAEGDGGFHPVSPKVGGVGVNVDTAVARDLWLACGYPFPIDVLPAVAVCGDKVQQEGVHGIGVQSCDTNLQHREHPSERSQKQPQRHISGSLPLLAPRPLTPEEPFPWNNLEGRPQRQQLRPQPQFHQSLLLLMHLALGFDYKTLVCMLQYADHGLDMSYRRTHR